MSDDLAVNYEELLYRELKSYFGFSQFKALQKEIILETLSGRDVLAVLPTGGGKSLCYQLPALLREGFTAVVSPLIALMKDQVDGLKEIGISAAFLNSSQSEEEAQKTWAGLYSKQYKILYLSPERLLIENMLNRLLELGMSAVAIDEAHCISSWGHDFRPEYRLLSLIKAHNSSLPIIALTATATDQVQNDICHMLKLSPTTKKFIASFNRPNLNYTIIQKHSPTKQLLSILEKYSDSSVIIYCLSRAKTEAVASQLIAHGFNAAAYHAGLTGQVRSLRQEAFQKDKILIIVATVAFGMGINKPDVRAVIHYDLPKNIESYYQETGRAGRDGEKSDCTLLYSPSDAAKIRSFNDELTDEKTKKIANSQLNQLLNFAESSLCRRIELLKYFGEQFATESGCNACDNCLNPRESFDGKLLAQKILSCILRVQKKSGFAVGMHHIVSILRGAKNEKIAKFGHDTLSTFGIGKELSTKSWLYYINQIVSLGLIQIDKERFNTLVITDSGIEFLKNGTALSLRRELLVINSNKKSKTSERKSPLLKSDYSEPTSNLSQLYEKLKKWRTDLSNKKNLPAFMILPNKALEELSNFRPTNIGQLKDIYGMGEKKIALYGEDLLSLINGERI
jgi:ATP-dependent DNA helicase RecQ